jgi:filamentous hemagglutinin
MVQKQSMILLPIQSGGTIKDTGRFGKVMDVIAPPPDGRGLRYDSNGKFIGLLEPPKP